METTLDEYVEELHEIAFKFFRGNNQENRAGYKEAGLVERFTEIEALLKRGDWSPGPPEAENE